MNKKLLNKTLRANLIFSVCVLLIAAPLFYLATRSLYLEETDESLYLKKNEFLNYFHTQFKEADILLWNKINKDVIVRKNLEGISKDTLFYRTYFDSFTKEDEYCRVLESPIKIVGANYVITAKVSLVESEDLLEDIALLFLGVLLVLLIGFYFITRVLSKKLWHPFYETLEKIEQFEIDKGSPPHFKAISIEEFERLNKAISKLMIRNMAIYTSQREFVENAAHELQTPLAVFQAKIDNLIQQPDITSEQAEVLSQLNDVAGRLNKLNRNLLLLSKIESHQFTDMESVVLNDVLSKQIPFFREQAESKELTIDIQMPETIELRSNHSLLEILISNLFLNAISHNIRNGSIHIKLTGNSLQFSNTGSQMALDEKKLFKRFAKMDPSSSGNGLGLAIMKKIADINSWTIVYKYENNLHIFEIGF